MSSMLRATTVLMLVWGATLSLPAQCQDGREWDQARAQLVAGQRGTMGQAIERWKLLSSSDRFLFSDYAGFLLSYPGFPMEEKLRGYAEAALEREPVDAPRLIAYFERFAPLTNPARARQALALAAMQRPEARGIALTAWRGGVMSAASEAAIQSLLGPTLTANDQDARMNALLWAGATEQAARQIALVSPEARSAFMERLAIAQGSPPGSLGLPVTGAMMSDSGYMFNRVRAARRAGNIGGAIGLLANRGPVSPPPLDPQAWIAELLAAAKGADASNAVRIAASVDDSFAPGTDVSRLGFKLRDDYTTLMWLGGAAATFGALVSWVLTHVRMTP